MASNPVIDLRTSLQPQKSGIVTGLEGLLGGFIKGQEKQKKQKTIQQLLIDTGDYDSATAKAISKLEPEERKFKLTQDAKKKQFEQTLALNQQKVDIKQQETLQKQQEKAQTRAATDKMIDEASGIPPDQKEVAKEIVANASTGVSSAYIKGFETKQNIFGRYLAPNQPVLSPGAQSQLSGENVNKVLQQLEGGGEQAPQLAGMDPNAEQPQSELIQAVNRMQAEGMSDEEIAQKIHAAQAEQDQERQQAGESTDPRRAVAGFGIEAGGAQVAKQVGGSPLLALTLGNLGIDAVNSIGKLFGRDPELPSIQEKAGQEFEKLTDTMNRDMEKLVGDIVERKTGKRPDIKIETPKPPLKAAAKYVSYRGPAQAVRDVAKSFGLDLEPRTYIEKKSAQLGAGIGALFDPKSATKGALLEAFKIAGVRAGGAEGLGVLGKVITGNDLVDKGLTFAGYLISHRYPGAVNKFKDEHEAIWEKSIRDRTKSPVVQGRALNDTIRSIENETLIGDAESPAHIFVRDKIVRSIESAERDGQYGIGDLNSLHESLAKETLKGQAVLHEVEPILERAQKAVKDSIDTWGKKNDPEALKSFHLADSITATQQNTNDIIHSIEGAAKSRMTRPSVPQLVIKVLSQPFAGVLKEAKGFLTSHGMRSAYYNLIKSGAKKDPQAIAVAATRFAAQFKKMNLSLYQEIMKK